MYDALLVILILAGTLTLFIWGRWRYDVVACLSLSACGILGLVSFSSVYQGFANPAVITVACVMIISDAINRTGIVDLAVKRMTPITSSNFIHIGILTVLAAVLSAFMNNVGALTLIMPLAIQTAWKSKRSPSLVLMPVAFGSALGGLLTSIGTPPNIIISNLRQQVIGQPFGLFDFTPVGLAVAAAGICFIVLVGWRLIPIRRKANESSGDAFQIQDYITEIQVPASSPMVGQSIRDLEEVVDGEVSLLALIRNNKKRLIVKPREIIKEDDIFIIQATHEDLEKLIHKAKLELVGSSIISNEELLSDEVTVMEVVVPPDSICEGYSSKTLRLRTYYGINLIALSRNGHAFKQRLSAVKFQGGDIALLQGNAESLREMVVSLGFLPLVERGVQIGIPRRIILPIAFFGIAILLTALQIVPVQIAFSGTVVALAVTNVLPARRLYQSIDWSIIVLLAAMIPVGSALQSTGATDLIAKELIQIAGSLPTWMILSLLMIITMTLSDFMNNAATALIIGPISIAIAQALGVSVDPFLMGVAVASSCSFLTPIGHQNNILVMGPGGYQFGDYFRLGIFLEIIIMLVSVPMILWIWPLG